MTLHVIRLNLPVMISDMLHLQNILLYVSSDQQNISNVPWVTWKLFFVFHVRNKATNSETVIAEIIKVLLLAFDSLGPWSPIWAHNPNGISIGSAVFAQMTAECAYTLQWDASSPPQNCPFPWGNWTPSNTWFHGPTWVLNPNGISIGSAVFAGLTSVTDQQTDRRRYWVGNNRPHLRTYVVRVMRSNN